ncbi:MAG: hypothetical protein EA424_01575 [Planctomycetaceae bacterium]|nr:MAG: hypothetical protein EA424_01575 [Planctomycetaceae bacterium]
MGMLLILLCSGIQPDDCVPDGNRRQADRALSRHPREHAVRAEIVVEKLLCHEGTRGLAISVNDRDWIPIPEADGIPEPPWAYMHHTYPTVAVPLGQKAVLEAEASSPNGLHIGKAARPRLR